MDEYLRNLDEILNNNEEIDINEENRICNEIVNEINELNDFNNFMFEMVNNIDSEELNRIYDEIMNERYRFMNEFNSIINQQGGNNIFFDVVKQSEKENKKFNTLQIAYKLKFKNLPTDMNLLEGIMYGAIRSFLDQIQELHPNDYVKFFMLHDNLDTPIQTALIRWSEMTPELIFNAISSTVQSNKVLSINEGMMLYLTVIKSVNGGSGRFSKYLLKKKNSVSNIRNKDNSCFQQCIVIGKA
jgi:hypothetical protein